MTAPDRIPGAFPTFRLVWRLLMRLPGLPGFLVAQPLRMLGRTDDRAIVVGNVALATVAGGDVAGGLRATVEDMPPSRLRAAVEDVAARIEAGMSISGAFAEHPREFDAGLVAALRAGELSGDLVGACERYREQRRSVRGAAACWRRSLAYGGILAGLLLAVWSFSLARIYPSYASVFEGFGSGLPWLTRMFWGFGRLIPGTPIVFVAVAGVALWAAFRIARARNPALADSWASGLPGLRRLRTNLELAQFCGLLRRLVAAEVPLPEAVLVAGAAASARREAGIRRLAGRVERGETFSSALDAENVLPPRLTWHARQAERSGDLAGALAAVEAASLEEARHRVRWLPVLAFPAAVLVMGVLAGAFLVSFYLPLFRMSSAMGGF